MSLRKLAVLLVLLPPMLVVVSFPLASRSSPTRAPLRSPWGDRHHRRGGLTGHESSHNRPQIRQQRLLLLAKNQKSASAGTTSTSKPKSTPRRRTWEESFQRLKEYKAVHGHCSVPNKYKEDKRLGWFVRYQRQRHRKGTLKAEDRARLDELGFDWAGKRRWRLDSWNRKLEELKEYKRKFGHCLVNGEPRWSPLAQWVHKQRHMRKLLTESQRQSLDELGFVWEEVQQTRNDIKWDEMFGQIQHYKRVYGHAQVPLECPDNPQLGTWVHTQRNMYRQGRLPDDREAKLNSLGFVWKVFENNAANYTRLDEIWMEKYERLKEFRNEFNHTNVPQKYQEDPALYSWVRWQRNLHRDKSLRENREKLLEELGFEWDHGEQTLKRKWMDRYLDLVAFQKAHGHFNVPQYLHPTRYRWVTLQREFNANNKLDPQRKEMLDKIGFDWNFGPKSRHRN